MDRGKISEPRRKKIEIPSVGTYFLFTLYIAIALGIPLFFLLLWSSQKCATQYLILCRYLITIYKLHRNCFWDSTILLILEFPNNYHLEFTGAEEAILNWVGTHFIKFLENSFWQNFISRGECLLKKPTQI